MSDTEKMRIPEAAVEAAAHGLARQAWGDWEYVPDELRRLFLRDAKTVLEAAAPHMSPPVEDLEDALEDLMREWLKFDAYADTPRPTMYVETLQGVVDRFFK